jgi:hypothetical protein
LKVAGLKAVENRAQHQEPKGDQPQKKPSRLSALQAQVVQLAALLGQSIDGHAAQMRQRDETIAHLRGLFDGQSSRIDSLTVAYQAQGQVIERQAETIREQIEARREVADVVLTAKAAIDELCLQVASMQKDMSGAWAESVVEYRAMGGGLGVRIDELAARLTSTHEAIDNGVAALCRDVTALRDKVDENAAVTAKVVQQIEPIEGNCNTIVQDAFARIDVVSSAVKGLSDDVKDLEIRMTGAITEQDGISANRVRTLSGELAEIRTETAQLAQGLETSVRGIEAAAELQTQRTIAALELQDKTIRAWAADVVDDAIDAASKANADTDRTVVALTERLDQVANLVEEIGPQMDTAAENTRTGLAEIGQRISELDAHNAGDIAGVRSSLQELRERLRTTVSALPKNVLVDSEGNLVAINGNGDAEYRGQMRGKAGRDGAELLDAQLRDGCLVLQMTDGRKMATQNVVQQVVQEVQLQVVDALSKQGASATQIRGLFGNQPKRTQKVKDEGQGKEPAAAARRSRRK